MGYIRIPLETNPEQIASDIFNRIRITFPNWNPNEGNLDTILARAIAARAAEIRTLASDVQDDIFASFGSSIMGIPPQDAVPATVNTTWFMIDSLGHTIPAGTFVSIANANGDGVAFQTIVDTVIPVGVNQTAVGGVTVRAVEPGLAGNLLTANPVLVDILDFVDHITIVGTTSGGLDAELFDDYLNRLVRRLSSLSTVPILPADFANAALDADPSVYRAIAIDGYNPFHNLLSANDSSFETSVAGYAGTNAALAQSAAFAADGANSMRLTAASAADMSAALIQADQVAVIPGETLTAIASFRTAVTARNCKVGIAWYTSGNALISTSFGATVADTAVGFTQAFVTAVAPATAAFARVVVFVTAPANAEVHYVDKVSLRHGSTTDWVIGGTAETNNIRTVTIAAVDINGNDVSGAIKTAIAAYINARREANWITNVISPRYTNIDVAASIKVLPGFASATVNADVVAALTSYLSPAVFAVDPNASTSADALRTWVDLRSVYYNELIALVSNVTGVDRVTDLTVNIHGFAVGRVDIALDYPAALTTPGTITSVAV